MKECLVPEHGYRCNLFDLLQIDGIRRSLQQADVTGLDDNTWDVDSERSAKWKRTQASQMLREDYTALTAAAMGNSLLHTAALAADSKAVAEVALEHLANITTFLVQMNELTPKVVARELSLKFPCVKSTIGVTAARNALLVWKKLKK